MRSSCCSQKDSWAPCTLGLARTTCSTINARRIFSTVLNIDDNVTSRPGVHAHANIVPTMRWPITGYLISNILAGTVFSPPYPSFVKQTENIEIFPLHWGPVFDHICRD